MLTLSVGTIGILILGQISKQYITPKYGDTGLHIFLFIVAFVVVVIKGLMTTHPAFGAMVTQTGEMLAAAIAVYEVVIKQVMSVANSPM